MLLVLKLAVSTDDHTPSPSCALVALSCLGNFSIVDNNVPGLLELGAVAGVVGSLESMQRMASNPTATPSAEEWIPTVTAAVQVLGNLVISLNSVH